MNDKKPYKKFQPQRDKVARLEESSARFRRIYSEYEAMSEDLWTLENVESPGIPDDFLESIRLQTSYLEEEISDWLAAEG